MRSFVKLVLCWLVLGFDLAFVKAQLFGICSPPTSGEWIGFQLRIFLDKVQVVIPLDKVEELTAIIGKFLGGNVVSLVDLRSFTGKTEFVAGVIIAWKPFVSTLWAAINAEGTERGGDVPPGCVWTAQIRRTLKWFLVFLDPERNPHYTSSVGIVRTWTLAAYLGRGTIVEIVWDASPWGLGAVLVQDGVPTHFIRSEITHHDETRFQHRIGQAEGQQTWESLTPLVALRCWKSYWMSSRVQLHVKGDNVTSLELVLNARARGQGPALVSRELALDLGDGAFRPAAAVHVPGVANIVADQLSRYYQPGQRAWSIPAYLHYAEETIAPVRDESYYLSDLP